MEQYTFEELEKMTCQSFGGNNCVLHGCMFDCQLSKAKKQALMRERGFTLNQAEEYLKQIKKMTYKKPEILAQSAKTNISCRPNSKPSGRPCNPPKPDGR